MAHYAAVPKTANINVRLDPGLKRRVEAMAQGYGTTASMVIRLLLARLLEQIEAEGDRLLWPPEFKSYKSTPYGKVAEGGPEDVYQVASHRARLHPANARR